MHGLTRQDGTTHIEQAASNTHTHMYTHTRIILHFTFTLEPCYFASSPLEHSHMHAIRSGY